MARQLARLRLLEDRLLRCRRSHNREQREALAEFRFLNPLARIAVQSPPLSLCTFCIGHYASFCSPLGCRGLRVLQRAVNTSGYAMAPFVQTSASRIEADSPTWSGQGDGTTRAPGSRYRVPRDRSVSDAPQRGR